MRDSATFFTQKKSHFVPLAGQDRGEILAYAQTQGLPNRRQENWHYTDLPHLLDRPLTPTQFTLFPFADQIKDDGFQTIHFDNGKMDAPVQSILQSQEWQPETEAMPAYNLALLDDGCDLSLPAGTHKLYLSYSGDIAAHYRHRIQLQEGADAVIIHDFASASYINNVIDLELSETAKLRLISLQRDGQCVNLIRGRVAASASVQHHHLSLNCPLARHDIRLSLTGAQARADIFAGLIAGAGEHSDFTSLIHHHHQDSHSDNQIRTIIEEDGRAVFQGKIIVARDAQYVEANQKCDALMLADGAEMNIKPELEIYADDVACAHGATIGKLDEEALFYLRSRGIKKGQAQHLLLKAFLIPLFAAYEGEAIGAALQTISEDKLREML